ncbi:MAG: RNA polymerase sigma factor [Myxococcota bacterium]
MSFVAIDEAIVTTETPSATPRSAPLLGEEFDLDDLLRRGYRYALSLAHDEPLAEDLLQDAWLSLLKAGSARTPSYLFRAVRSRFIDRYRRQQLVVMTGMDDAGEAELAQASDLGQMIASELVERALGELRAEEREAIYLAAVEGYTGDEISALTGRSPGAVRTMLHRVRAKLRSSVTRDQTSEVPA